MPQCRVGAFGQCGFEAMNNTARRILITGSKRATDPLLADQQISVKSLATFANDQHRVLVLLASICNTTVAGTAFLPFFPGGAKSSTVAPIARRRLYTVPREHRQRV